MSLRIYDTLETQGDFPAVKAEDVQMPDGTRLSDFEGSLPVPGVAQVGQILRVAAVDENGVITALEAVEASGNMIFMTEDEYRAYRNSDSYNPTQAVGIWKDVAV